MAVLVEHQSWNDQAEAALVEALGEDRNALKNEVESGVSSLWCFDQGRFFLITRKEQKELVVCCAAGVGLSEYAPLIIQAAKDGGSESVRFHTKRRGLNRMLSACGFNEVESVYRLGV